MAFCIMFYRLLSEIEYNAVRSASYSDLLHTDDINQTQIHDLYMYYIYNYKPIINIVNNDNFKTYMKLLKYYKYHKLIRKDLDLFKSNLTKVMENKLKETKRNMGRLIALYEEYYNEHQNESYHLLSFNEFIKL